MSRKRKKKKSLGLADYSWEAILTEFLFLRVPKNKVTGMPLAPYEAAAKEYLATYPDSVPNAVKSAQAEIGEYADADHVLTRLDPPFLHWARTVKNMDLNDFEGALYPTRR